MPVLILLGIGLFYLCSWLYNNIGKNTKPYNREESEKILSDVVGKPVKEQRKTINDYQKERKK